MSLCNTCRKANVSCPVYPLDTRRCVEYAGTNQCDGCNAGMPIVAGVHWHAGVRHMVCTNGRMGIPQRKADIANRLYRLSKEIIDISTAMDYYGGFAPWAKHSREMIGAAAICREWAAEIMASGG